MFCPLILAGFILWFLFIFIKVCCGNNRYHVKFRSDGPMGINLMDRLPRDGTGVCVEYLVEGQKAAQTGKIKVGDILICINADNVSHMMLKQVLTKIRAF